MKIEKLSEEKAKIIFNEMFLTHIREAKLIRVKEKEEIQRKLDYEKKKKNTIIHNFLSLFDTRDI